MFSPHIPKCRILYIPVQSFIFFGRHTMTSLHQNDKVLHDEVATTTMKTPDPKSPIKSIPTNDHVKQRYHDIVKSANDKRLYRGLLLNNEMRILLISDPTTDKSAAALNVNIGYMSDPDDLPGLAHFCEHMLFLGTEKYPEENEYTKFLSQNGGRSNAVTSADNTNYYFDVTPEKLQGALDRFAQFFITPLFTESLTELELNSVNLEHEKNITNDMWRINQLEKSSALPNHPFCKFGTGNKETLEIIPKQKNINVRERLLDFHKTFYSANIMSLCILGKETLDELEAMVVDLFSEVKNREVDVPTWPTHPFDKEHFETKWYIVPIKDVRSLNMTFPLPNLQEHYRSVPAYYVAYLLGHEGEGSLLSALKEKSWCNSLVSGERAIVSRGFRFFNVLVDLTEEGIEHVDDIIKLTFQYINMLKNEGPTEWIYNEYKDIADMNFQFEEKISPRTYVSGTAQALQKYRVEDVLIGEHLFLEWRPDLINTVLEQLIPQNVRIQIVGKVYENIVNESERWYGTKFKKEKIPSEIVNKWLNAGLDPDLKLPKKNEFIPTRFNIKTPDVNADKYPVIVQDTPIIRLWFKQDDEFLVPKANLTFVFVSPLAHMDPISCNLTYMFVTLFQDSFNEYVYAAHIAGIKCELNTTRYGMTLSISGYDDKLRVLLSKILDKMVSFQVDPKRFEILKENYMRGLKNFVTEQPYYLATYFLSVLLAEHVWLKSEVLEACSQLTVKKVEEFIPKFLSKVHVECVVHGNMTVSEAIEIAKLVETKLTTSISDIVPLLPKQLVLHREIKLEDGCHFAYKVDNELHKSSCTEIYYQAGLQSTESNVLLELLAQIISEPCFNILRTKEQLGYIVFSGVHRANGVQGLGLIVQSDKHPEFLEKRIEAFLNTMKEHISTMSDNEFNRHKESLAVQRLEKPKMLSALFSVFCSEILSQVYNFDRANIEVAHLRTITREQVLNFFLDITRPAKQHKLSIHIVSKAEGGAGLEQCKCDEDAKDAKTAVKIRNIEDITAFKISQSLHPRPPPFINIPRKGACSSKL